MPPVKKKRIAYFGDHCSSFSLFNSRHLYFNLFFSRVCPSAFFYIIVLLSTLISLRRDMVSCITQGISEDSCFVVNAETADGLTKVNASIISFIFTFIHH